MKLSGVSVVVTRAPAQVGELVAALEEAGAEVVELPLIDIAEPSSFEALDDALQRLASDGYDWALFTSVNAVERFYARAGNNRALDGVRVAAVGAATSEALAARDVTVDLVPSSYTGDALADALGPGTGSVLIPRAEAAPRGAIDKLEAGGWACDAVPAYRTVAGRPPPAALERVRSGAFDAITFTSGSTVRNFVSVVGPPDEVGLQQGSETGPAVACIGPVTARVATEQGFKVDVMPHEHTAPGLAGALVAFLSHPSRGAAGAR